VSYLQLFAAAGLASDPLAFSSSSSSSSSTLVFTLSYLFLLFNVCDSFAFD